MAEQLKLSTPVPAPPSLVGYRLFKLAVNRGYSQEEASIEITLIGNNRQLVSHAYYGVKAFNMIFALNTANFTTKSLERNILELLTTEGVIKGTVIGTPNPVPDPNPWPPNEKQTEVAEAIETLREERAEGVEEEDEPTRRARRNR